jgi:hypothetical protein
MAQQNSAFCMSSGDSRLGQLSDWLLSVRLISRLGAAQGRMRCCENNIASSRASLCLQLNEESARAKFKTALLLLTRAYILSERALFYY